MNPPDWNAKIKSLAKTVINIQRPKIFDKVAVIVEPRNLDVTTDLLKWMMWLLVPAGWKFVFFAGKNNIKCITEFVHSLKVEDVIEIKNLDKENLTIREYNLLLATNEFWSSLPYENVLIFQTDSVLLDNNLTKFLGYDYVGAPWRENLKWLKTEGISVKKIKWLKTPGINIVGNGGLSLRRKSAMIRVIKLVHYAGGGEDIYFAIKCKHLLNIPSPDFASTFSVESVVDDNTKGYHKCWDYLGKDMDKVYKRIDGIIHKLTNTAFNNNVSHIYNGRRQRV